ncbi:serine/threonine-protein kinase [Tuwongella immobilis]|uniref:Protein kinase domain-containing protein n=1 Tax=Tuwongella immobilis TaxID=692036 RepID=A0A6C2YI76_9BACT|nr:serine/threonine-protein kinase [Tuwongella immobilis]VIP01230.1 serine threonine protein kinase : Serine/threonine kinase PKN9 OS=Candidatus Chloracidobacterium thermophilum GN=YS_M60-F11.065 PE=3 SV=1: Pkinase [Tuwongella immobilis]VTR97886.1 serine threonine protein kinase : Serine/threonine kinase PKN9 OS=Candidatus Chloracidobacterium thermophilum GN=YS_M60-F11.065 PE=3 SV=1: Pkinase [Tuwongella immobilis]
MHRPPHIPGYELFQSLGDGATSIVYAGRDVQTDEEVAVKVLREDWFDDATALQLLRREARTGMAVEHSHLVKILEARLSQPPYFLVMNRITGESVRQRMYREYCLDHSTAIWIARQTADALHALHRANFIHGDVKPDNIRLVDNGHAVLIDLGFSHIPGENQAVLEQGFVLGTPNYLPPEMCDRNAVDHPAGDIYALGISLFEMLTGELPYPTGSVKEVMRRHRVDPAASLWDYPGPWPTALIDLVDAMLERRWQSRPTAMQVVDTLITCEIHSFQVRRAA